MGKSDRRGERKSYGGMVKWGKKDEREDRKGQNDHSGKKKRPHVKREEKPKG